MNERMNETQFHMIEYGPICRICFFRVLPLLFYLNECKHVYKIFHGFFPHLFSLNVCFHELLSSAGGYFTVYKQPN